MSQPKHITINENTYNVSDLNEEAITIVNNIQLAETAINEAQAKHFMFKLAKESLIKDLVEATKDLPTANVEEQA